MSRAQVFRILIQEHKLRPWEVGQLTGYQVRDLYLTPAAQSEAIDYDDLLAGR